MSPAEVIRARQDGAPARPRRRRLPDRHEVGVHARRRRRATRYVICNADEGEPGTFKDRVLLTERADLLFEGMTIAGYAIGAEHGHPLPARRVRLPARLPRGRARASGASDGLLGKNVMRQAGLRLRHPHPDGRRRLRLRRGDRADQLLRGPARRPEEPAAVPGPEGLPRPPDHRQQRRDALLRRRGSWRRARAGSPSSARRGSTGHEAAQHLRRLQPARRLRGALRHHRCARCSRLCRRATTPWRVQVGGPSGQMVGPADFDRTICYDDLATGGSIMVFGPERDLLEIVARVHGVLRRGELRLLHALPRRQRAAARSGSTASSRGRGEPADLDYLREPGQEREDRQPLRPRADLAESGPDAALENFRDAYDGPRPAARRGPPAGLRHPAANSARPRP